MSYKAVRQVLESGQPTGPCRLVKIVIAEHANDQGWSWPSFETIAKEAVVGVRHTKRIIRGLEIAGHIEIQHGNGRSKSNRYRIKNSDQAASPFYPPKTVTKLSHPNHQNHQVRGYDAEMLRRKMSQADHSIFLAAEAKLAQLRQQSMDLVAPVIRCGAGFL